MASTRLAELPEQKTVNRDSPPAPPATVNRVSDFVAERKAEKDKAFSYVLSRSGWIFAGATLVYIPVTALTIFEFLPAGIGLYLASAVFLMWGVSLILLSTLPLDTFDFDATVDSLPAVRRMATIGFLALFSTRALSFPYIPGGLGACVCLVKFVWEELDIGCCAPRVLRRQDTCTTTSASRCGGGRPRITTVFCIYYAVLATGFHDIAQYVFDVAPCHAGAAASNYTTNTTTNTTTASRMCSFG